MKIFLDFNAPQTNFLLGVLLAGGNVREFAQRLVNDQATENTLIEKEKTNELDE